MGERPAPRTPSGLAQGVDAPGPTTGKGKVQKNEAVQDCRIAAVQDGEEASRRVGDEIGDGPKPWEFR